MKHDTAIDAKAVERRLAWAILRGSPTLRMLSNMLTGPYWPRSGRIELAPAPTMRDEAAQRQLLYGEATRFTSPAQRRFFVQRRELRLDDALDDSFPASDPPMHVAPGYRPAY